MTVVGVGSLWLWHRAMVRLGQVSWGYKSQFRFQGTNEKKFTDFFNIFGIATIELRHIFAWVATAWVEKVLGCNGLGWKILGCKILGCKSFGLHQLGLKKFWVAMAWVAKFWVATDWVEKSWVEKILGCKGWVETSWVVQSWVKQVCSLQEQMASPTLLLEVLLLHVKRAN